MNDENKPDSYTGKQAYTISYIPTYIHTFIHPPANPNPSLSTYSNHPLIPMDLNITSTYYIKTYTLTCIYIDITYYICAMQV